MTNGSLMKVERIANGAFCNDFWPALSDNRFSNNFGPLFEWPLKTGLLYAINYVQADLHLYCLQTTKTVLLTKSLNTIMNASI